MAITKIVEKPDRAGRRDPEVREYERVFWVFTDDPLDGQNAVLEASSDGITIPQVGEEFPDDADALVTSVDATTLDGDPQAWEVRVSYSAGGITFGPGVLPLLDPAEVHIGATKNYEIVEREVFHDDEVEYPDDPRGPTGERGDFRQTRDDGLFSRPVVNVNRERFDPPPMIEVNDLSITVSRNEAFYSRHGNPLSLNAIYAFMGSVNKDEFTFLDTVFPPRSARLSDINAVLQNLNGFRFWRVTYQFDFREKLWVKEIANLGYTTWRVNETTDTGEWGRVKDDNGQDASEPQWLEWDGTQVPHDHDDPERELPYIRFYVYKEMPFQALLMPRRMADLVR